MKQGYIDLNTTSIVENLPMGIIILNPHGQLEWWNNQAAQLLDLSENQFNIFLGELILEPDFEKYLSKEPKERLEINSPNKPYQRLGLSVMDYKDTHYIVLIEDITRTYQLEKMRQDFVANVSHELRTPLTVIRGYLEMLVDNQTDFPKRWLNTFEQMHLQSLRMDKIVEDLLLLSRLETDATHNRKEKYVNISDLLASIITEARALSGSREHQFTLSADKTLKLLGQENELHSAFSNIIFNAVHYTPESGIINIHWYKDEQGAHLKVADTGIGIAAKHIPRLTERFYRVDKARSRSQGGTGLGLAIVKHVLLRHNARLIITSDIGTGSVFDCVFDLKRVRVDD